MPPALLGWYFHQCQKCSPANQSAFVIDNTTEEDTVNKEELDIHNCVILVVEKQMKVRIGSAMDVLKKNSTFVILLIS